MVFPIREVHPPAILTGQSNGRLDPAILVTTPGLAGGPNVVMVEPAARAWRAMAAAAQADGIILQTTSLVDSYRPYAVQYNAFHDRYTTQRNTEWDTKVCGGVVYYQKPGTASAACPGTSNHGLGLADDIANASGGRLDWLLAHAWDYGFSWELQSEPWHIRYCTGDAIPPAVLAYERGNQDMDVHYKIQSVDQDWNGRTYVSNRINSRRLRSPGSIQTPALAETKEVLLTDKMRGTEPWDSYLQSVAGPYYAGIAVELSDAQLNDLASKVVAQLQALVFKAQ